MSRTRTDGYVQPQVSTSQQTWTVGATCSDFERMVAGPPLVEWYTPYERSRSMTDELTVNFYRRSARGEVIVNPMTQTFTEITREPISSWNERRRRWRVQGCQGLPVNIPYQGGWWVGPRSPTILLGAEFPAATSGMTLDQAKAIAVTAAYAKANEQDVEGLVILAEGQKTIHSITSITGRLIKILRMIKRANVKGLSKEFSPKELSNRWMEGRYAIRPLVKDMCDVVKAIKRDRTDKPRRRTYRSSVSDSSHVVVPDVVTYSYSDYWKIHASKRTDRTMTVRSGVLSALEEISEATIWGLNQPFTAMWELVPFSFVVDWFLNVGKTIASWTPRYGIRALASWVTVEETVLSAIHCIGGQLGTWGTSPYDPYIWENSFSCAGGSITKVVKTKTRVANPNRSILPTWQVRLDAAKLLDLAIMAKRFI